MPRNHRVVESAATSKAPPARPPRPGRWERFLDQKTAPQRFVLAVAAMAAAIGVIGGAAVWIGGWLGGSRAAERLLSADLDGDVIESGTAQGDAFVRFLLDHAGADPVELNVDVRAPDGWQETTPNMVLWYLCDPGEVVGDGACLRVRLELPSDSPVLTKPLGWRFRGTYRIAVRTGAGFGTDLDIVFDDITR